MQFYIYAVHELKNTKLIVKLFSYMNTISEFCHPEQIDLAMCVCIVYYYSLCVGMREMNSTIN